MRVPKHLRQADIRILDKKAQSKATISEDDYIPVVTESFCSKEVKSLGWESLDSLTDGTSRLKTADVICDVYVDYEVEPLTLLSFIVILIDSEYEKADEQYSRRVLPEVVFRYDEEDFREKSEGQIKKGDSIIMQQRSEITIEDQYLALHRIENPIEPLKLELKMDGSDERQTFAFSIESVTDARGTTKDSGAYNMNI